MIIDEWKRLAKAGKATDGEKLFKQGTILRADGAPVDDSAPITFIMSTAAVDRMDDTIAVEGWDLANFRKNPVWLFGHNSYDLPVGKSLREYVQENSLRSDVVFTSRDENEFGWQVGRLVRGGFLNACSVGFSPKKWAVNEDRGGSSWSPACDFLEQELLECSVVPIPANPEALVQGKAAGVEMAPILVWAEGVLSRAHGKGLWLPQDAIADTLRAQAEATWKALRPVQVQVPAAPEARGDNKCSACGKGVHEAWKFCPMCGKEISTPENPEVGAEDESAKALEAVRSGVKSAFAK